MVRTLSNFVPVREAIYRKRRGILILRDCIVGHIPPSKWPRIQGRKPMRPLTKLRPWEHIRFGSNW